MLDARDHALAAYEATAPFYDSFTADLDYDAWAPDLDRLAREAGADGGLLLDVACGTGKSFAAFAALGWTIDGCDLSPAMLDQARARGGARQLWRADMRALPQWGAYDLATCLDDALNYLHSEEELTSAFAGIARNLRPGGVLLFDVNTIFAYTSFFTRVQLVERPGELVICEGLTEPDPPIGGHARLRLTRFAETDGGWQRSVATHHERHHPQPVVARALDGAGLELVAAYGQDDHFELLGELDERAHWKALYVARRAP